MRKYPSPWQSTSPVIHVVAPADEFIRCRSLSPVAPSVTTAAYASSPSCGSMPPSRTSTSARSAASTSPSCSASPAVTGSATTRSSSSLVRAAPARAASRAPSLTPPAAAVSRPDTFASPGSSTTSPSPGPTAPIPSSSTAWPRPSSSRSMTTAEMTTVWSRSTTPAQRSPQAPRRPLRPEGHAPHQ